MLSAGGRSPSMARSLGWPILLARSAVQELRSRTATSLRHLFIFLISLCINPLARRSRNSAQGQQLRSCTSSLFSFRFAAIHSLGGPGTAAQHRNFAATTRLTLLELLLPIAAFLTKIPRLGHCLARDDKTQNARALTNIPRLGHCLARDDRKNYSLLIVSSKFNIVLATMV